MKGIGLEALLMLLLCGEPARSLEEGRTEYGISLEELEAKELLDLIERAKKRLEELGLAMEAPIVPEHLRISRELRIFLPDRGEQEMQMPPLVKALFIFFLKHPEGIVFKELADHREELFGIYSRVCRSGDLPLMKTAVERLTDPCNNSINTMRTRLSRSLSDYFPDDRLLALYRIKGTAGQEKRIELDRNFVIWEQ